MLPRVKGFRRWGNVDKDILPVLQLSSLMQGGAYLIACKWIWGPVEVGKCRAHVFGSNLTSHLIAIICGGITTSARRNISQDSIKRRKPQAPLSAGSWIQIWNELSDCLCNSHIFSLISFVRHGGSNSKCVRPCTLGSFLSNVSPGMIQTHPALTNIDTHGIHHKIWTELLFQATKQNTSLML